MSNSISIAIFLLSVLIASLSQLLLKYSATKTHKTFLQEYLNKEVIFAYGLFGLSTLMTTYAYKNVAISLGPVLEATGYIYIMVLSFLFLKEKLKKVQILGMFFIIVGIVIFAVGS